MPASDGAAGCRASDADTTSDADALPGPAADPHVPMVCWGRVRRGTAVKLCFRVLAAGVPIIGGAFVSDLGTILSWTGVVGVFIGLTVPALLQIASRTACAAELAELERERSGRSGVDASPLPQEATPMLDGVGGSSPAGLELEASAMGTAAAVAGGDSSLNVDAVGAAAGSAAPADEDDAEAAAGSVVEHDDLVLMLHGLRAGAAGRSGGGAAAAAGGASSAAQVRRVLRTPFDHRVLSHRPAAWGVVVLSGVMVVVVVTGLLLFGGG